jgi:hypothetical protein
MASQRGLVLVSLLLQQLVTAIQIVMPYTGLLML